jgi:isovaleryl-CoA dehydrogenase
VRSDSFFNSLQYALPYVHERKQFGKPIGTFQLMQGKIADMYTKMNAARAYAYAVGRGVCVSLGHFCSGNRRLISVCVFAKACDAGQVSRRDCAGTILYASDRALEVATGASEG